MVLSGCGSSREAPGGQGSAGDPPAGEGLGHDVRFYVNPDGNAVQAVAGLREREEEGGATAAARHRQPADGHLAHGRLRRRVRRGPEHHRGGRGAGHPSGARRLQPAQPRLRAVLVRGCRRHRHLPRLAGVAGCGGRRKPALVVLEPDAIAQSLEGCGSDGATDERYRMLAEAVDILERQPHVRVYLDAGNASWIEDLDALAAALEASGVAKADGFALNVSNFETTERSAAYGRKLSQRLGGAHFVIDTSRNGAGPPPTAAAKPGSHPSWCNPPGRRLGTRPTTDTGIAEVDALLWVKQPGDSDGECGGAPPAGTFDTGLAGALLDALGQPAALVGATGWTQ